jgi:hypothetical protein
MKIPPPLELIRQKKAFYLGEQEPSGRFLAVQLADCAMISGARRVELQALAGGWMAVSADAEWITPNLQQQRDRSMESAFTAMIPLRGGRPNQIRFEVFVTAFSTSVSVRSAGRWITIVGEPPPLDVRDQVAKNEFAVVFQAEVDS